MKKNTCQKRKDLFTSLSVPCPPVLQSGGTAPGTRLRSGTPRLGAGLENESASSLLAMCSADAYLGEMLQLLSSDSSSGGSHERDGPNGVRIITEAKLVGAWKAPT